MRCSSEVEREMLTMLLLKYFIGHISSLAGASGGFDEMLASTQRYYVFGGKGGGENKHGGVGEVFQP